MYVASLEARTRTVNGVPTLMVRVRVMGRLKERPKQALRRKLSLKDLLLERSETGL